MPARAACPIGFAPGPSMCARLRGRSGLDHGPISVHDKMAAMGLEAPSPASLARIFRQEGVARAEPSKRPRAAWRRFVYPAPNACWQLDATEYVLAGGRKAVILQLQDNHWRLAVASLVAPGDGRSGGHRRLRQGRSRPGRAPGARAADNGAAPGPSRRGVTGRLVEHVRSLGVEPITGKPYRPTTQGKNERFGQTLLRYLDQQPLADSIAELQEQVDRFDHTLQHPAPPPGPARAHHPAAGLGRHRGRPGTPTGPRHRPHHPRRRTRARRARRAPTAAPAQAHRPQRRARTDHHPQRAPTTSAASRSWSAAPWPGTEPPRSGTPPPSPSPTSTARS